jgi:hypothetical protein
VGRGVVEKGDSNDARAGERSDLEHDALSSREPLLTEPERLERLRQFVRGFAELVIDLELELPGDRPHDR